MGAVGHPVRLGSLIVEDACPCHLCYLCSHSIGEICVVCGQLVLGLAQLPTPLDEAPRLSAALGARVLIKRDDLTGLALGGNKARKLEYLVRDAIDRGCDTLVTGGGAQSNHARMTAAAAAKMKMRCHLVLGGDRPSHFSGNLLLDDLFGAELHFTGTDDWNVWQSEIKRVAAQIGPNAYPIPIGGSTPVG